MPSPRVKYATVEEYFALEEQSPEKHEYYGGEIFAMAGASLTHNQIVSNTLVEVGSFLKNKQCQVFPSDLKIQVTSTIFTYPDISILCEDPKFHNRKDTITNPAVIIEVLSPSTEDYDRGKKSFLYRQISSLQEYILISSTEYRFEKYLRQKDGRWILSEVAKPEESIAIETIGFAIPLKELYRNVDFKLAETNV